MMTVFNRIGKPFVPKSRMLAQAAVAAVLAPRILTLLVSQRTDTVEKAATDAPERRPQKNEGD
jgi:hypothetical protein